MELDPKVRGRDVFVDNLKATLANRGMTAMDIARLVKISPSTMSAIINKASYPTLGTASLISSALDLELWWMCCPQYNPDIPQRQMTKVVGAVSEPGMTSKSLDEVFEFAKFKAM